MQQPMAVMPTSWRALADECVPQNYDCLIIQRMPPVDYPSLFLQQAHLRGQNCRYTWCNRNPPNKIPIFLTTLINRLFSNNPSRLWILALEKILPKASLSSLFVRLF